MRCDPVERILHRNQPGAPGYAPTDDQVARDVGEEYRVDALEQAVSCVPCLRTQQFFGNARPKYDGAGQAFALHDGFDRDGRRDIDRLARVVTFAMTRRPFDHGLTVGDAGHLRSFGNAVDVGAERNNRSPATPTRPPIGGNTCGTLCHGEAVLFQDIGEVRLSFEFLKTQFGKREETIDDLLDEFVHPVDFARCLGLEARQWFRCGRGFRGVLGGQHD